MLHGGRRVDDGAQVEDGGIGPVASRPHPALPARDHQRELSEHTSDPPSRTRRYTGSPSRQRLRSVTGCVRLSATTKTRTGKRLAVNSGARVRGSGGGSGKKRIRAKARASLTGGLQPLVEQRFAGADYDAQQTQARTRP